MKNLGSIFSWPLLLGIIMAAGFVLLFALYADLVSRGGTAALDDAIRSYVYSRSSPLLTQAVTAVSFFGTLRCLVGLGTVFCSILLYLNWYRALGLFLTTMAGEIFLELTLKALYQRARPVPFFDLPIPTSHSFPSGHALGSFCFYTMAAWIVTSRIRSTSARYAISISAAVFILAIGFSRIYLGVHYPSDVGAGFFAGFIWTATVIFADRYMGSSHDKVARLKW